MQKKNSIRSNFDNTLGTTSIIHPSGHQARSHANEIGQRSKEAKMTILNRRAFLIAIPVGLAACTTSPPPKPVALGTQPPRYPLPPPEVRALYAQVTDGEWTIPAVDLTSLPPRFLRQEVAYTGDHPVGTIVIDTNQHFLFLVQENGRAMRYGIGVGRQGFSWNGEARIARKAAWPSWYPPLEMQERDKQSRKWAGGMPGGLENPLGARALYLYQNGRDTLYRIHGTGAVRTIGQNVSSGCIRMLHQDVINLSERVPVGTKVVVLGPSDVPMEATGV